MQEERRKTNPVFNDRKLKLGTFGTNLDRGCAISTIDGVLEINWPNTLELARCSEEMEFEALVPIGRWHGFGGHTNFNGPGFECFSWASAIGASTKYSGIFATSHVPTIHPVMAAKQATTIDHVTGGRFALNIVTGWNRPEIEMFGSPLMEHNDRYDCAVEWLRHHETAVDARRAVRFRGPVLQHQEGLSAAEADPAAVPGGDECRRLRPRPALRGQALRHGLRGVRLARFRRLQGQGRRLPRSSRARNTAARSRSGATPMWCRATPKRRRRTISTNTSTRRATGTRCSNLVETMIANAKTLPPAVLAEMKKHFIAGWGGYPIIGTPEQIVDGLITMSKMGLDGTLLNWPRYIDDQRWFQKQRLSAGAAGRAALSRGATASVHGDLGECRGLSRDLNEIGSASSSSAAASDPQP